MSDQDTIFSDQSETPTRDEQQELEPREPTIADVLESLGKLHETVRELTIRIEELEEDPVRSGTDLQAWITEVWVGIYYGAKEVKAISANRALGEEMRGLFAWWRRATSKKATASDFTQWHDAAHRVIPRIELWESRRMTTLHTVGTQQ